MYIKFTVEAVDRLNGRHTILADYQTSAEARQFLRQYTTKENAGGWDTIEIYDQRGEEPERLALWVRN